MNKRNKLLSLALVLALGTGGLALAQTAGVGPAINPPPLNPQPLNPGAATPPSSPTVGTGVGARRGPGQIGQPRMEAALIALQEARRHLEAAIPDKGGFRDKAIASVDQAIKDVNDGIEYARTHPDEFRGARGTGPRGTEARGPRGLRGAPAGTSVPPAGG